MMEKGGRSSVRWSEQGIRGRAAMDSVAIATGSRSRILVVCIGRSLVAIILFKFRRPIIGLMPSVVVESSGS